MSEIPDDLDEDGEDEEVPIDPRITPDLFREWRSPRFGSANPTPMNNPWWEWLVRSRLDAFQANKRFDGPSPVYAGPGWCFSRFGQSETPLPDGRIVLIAGEHEDFYDPDFHIYNDVTVLHPDGRIDLFGYPPEVFPPTDFHTATLVGNRILIIGNLSYPDRRRPGATPVCALDLETFVVSLIPNGGTPPGWIHRHQASLSDDGASLIITQGMVECGDPDITPLENIDDWRLDLSNWTWERLTDRQWPCYEVGRADGGRHHLFEIKRAAWRQAYPEFAESNSPSLKEVLGAEPDTELFARLYEPGVPHEKLPQDENEFNIRRIKVNGVTVRYVENMDSVRVTVEGELPQETIDSLTRDLEAKLSALVNTACRVRKLSA